MAKAAKSKSTTKARVGGKKNQGWTNNARRAAARKRPVAAASKKAAAAATAIKDARELVKTKKRADRVAAAPETEPINLGPVVLPSAKEEPAPEPEPVDPVFEASSESAAAEGGKTIPF